MDFSEIFNLDYSTGKLYWKKSRGTAKAGKEAGCVNKISGYIDIMLCGKTMKAHRIVWLLCNPGMDIRADEEIDHIDHNKSNNKPSNLRKVLRQVNMKNLPRKTTNKSGVCGVHWDVRCGKWRAQIRIGGKNKHLGLFVSIDEAITAREAAKSLYGYHKNHGGHY